MSFDRIAHALDERIARSMYPEGTRLPPVRQLANEFQVTTATVSRALRVLADRGLVEPRERSGVYVRPASGTPSPGSRARTRLVGFIAFDTVVSPYWSVVVHEIEQRLNAGGYHLVLGNSNLDQQRAIDYIQSFARTGVEGLIFVPFDAPDPETYQAANAAVLQAIRLTGIPYVLYDRTVDDPGAVPASVGIDNEYYTGLLMDRLVAAGCQRPLALSVSYSTSIEIRERIFATRFPTARDEGRVVRLPTRRVTENHLNLIAESIDRSDIDSLFLVNSSVMNGFLRAREAGLIATLPEDIPFVGFEDFPVRGGDRALARALQAIRPLAQAAAEVCIDRIERQDGTWGRAHIDVRLPCTMVPGIWSEENDIHEG